MLLLKISDFGVTQKSKNRNSLEIVRDMLSAASVKTKKTRIMYAAHLSYRLMEKYLNTLLDSGLIERIDDSSYLITLKGKDFLQMYDDYLEQCKRIGEELRGVHKDRMLLENMCFNNEADSKQTAKEEEVLV
jgi:predicted transcriptional regulator